MRRSDLLLVGAVLCFLFAALFVMERRSLMWDKACGEIHDLETRVLRLEAEAAFLDGAVRTVWTQD